MSLLKRAIDARARGDRQELQAGTVSLGDVKSHAVGVIYGDGSVSVVSSGDAETDRDRLRLLERVLDWDSLPYYDIAATNAAHAAYERSRLGDTKKKTKTKKKSVRGIDGIRDRYV
jgi:hypothetical protein